jgi:hypothetical protein
VFFSHNHLLQLLESVLLCTALVSTACCLVNLLSKTDQVGHTFFANLKIVDESGTQTPGYL